MERSTPLFDPLPLTFAAHSSSNYTLLIDLTLIYHKYVIYTGMELRASSFAFVFRRYYRAFNTYFHPDIGAMIAAATVLLMSISPE